jgi:hypothetical protein
MNSVDRQIENLVALGVLQRQGGGDRFHVVGDDFVQVYVKYALARHGRSHEHARGYGGLSFAQAVVDAFVPTAFESPDVQSTSILRKQTSAELSRVLPRSLGERFREEVDKQNVPAINAFTSLGPLVLGDEPEGAEGWRAPITSHYAVVGITFQVSVVDVIDVLVLVELSSDDQSRLEQEVGVWRTKYESIMGKFEARVEDVIVTDLPSDLMGDVRDYAFAALGLFVGPLMDEFQNGNYESAIEIGRVAVEALEPYLNQYVGGRRYISDQHSLADALNRTGFITLLSGDPSGAQPLLQRSLLIDEREKRIRLFNMGCCYLADEDWGSAESCFETARAEWRVATDYCFLMAAIALPEELRSPDAQLTKVDNAWGRQFCEVHAVLARLRAEKATLADLAQAIEIGFARKEVPSVVQRILAWEYFSVGDRAEALATLLRAVALSPQDEVLRRELKFFEKRLEGEE